MTGPLPTDLDLAPCPFCAKADALRIGTAADLGEMCCDCYRDSDTYYAVFCDASTELKLGGCGASGGFAPTPEKAAERWNRRNGLCP